MCTAIWLSGLVVNLIRQSPFQPLAMVGGVLWCTGNILAAPIINMIGLGLGLLIWGTTNLVVGWASGNFGLFGIKQQTVALPVLNYLGVIFSIASICVFVLVKPELNEQKKRLSETQSLINSSNETPTIELQSQVNESNQQSILDKLSPLQKRILGMFLSVVSGVFYGVNFNPPQYLIDHGGPKDGIDYIFSHFCGIFLTSSFYLIVYAAVKKNRPSLSPEIVLPGMCSGFIWAIAQICFFIANSRLQMVVVFPIVSTGPGLVASLWGVFAFREIRGLRNFIFLSVAFLITFVGVGLITASKLA